MESSVLLERWEPLSPFNCALCWGFVQFPAIQACGHFQSPAGYIVSWAVTVWVTNLPKKVKIALMRYVSGIDEGMKCGFVSESRKLSPYQHADLVIAGIS